MYKMKDRAGTVGARGVGSLLRICFYGVRRTCTSDRTFIRWQDRAVGDSSRTVAAACRVDVVAAACRVASVFRRSGAGHGSGRGLPFGTAAGQKPILSTFSSHDFPLTKTFHLALRRGKDLGEARIAGAEPPSVYAALGGFGPRGCGERLIDIHALNSALRSGS